jgi:transposase-like protein
MSSLSFFQVLVQAIFPAQSFEKMREHSMKWRVQCDTCGDGQSVWELGGVRFGATSGKKTRFKCPSCACSRTATLTFVEENPSKSHV